MSKVKHHRDSGMTLPELLISVVLSGILIASMSMSISVLYGQADNTEGRVNNARSEQNINVWMPADLASAEGVDTTPEASPCAPSCPPGGDIGGTNALMLTWTGTTSVGGIAVPTVTKVSYRYVLVGVEYQLVRVECISIDGATPTCKRNTVLHDLDAPPISANYIEGHVKPTWIMVVSQALDPADTTGSTPIPTDDPTFKNKNGQRVVVTINGGGDVAGVGGGQNQISLSAGGTERRTDLATNSVSFNQTLTAARSRCGGNFGMVIDTSGSIGATNMATVRSAITSMIDTFAGTPVKLSMSQFATVAKILGAPASGARYFDMLKEADVADLKAYVNGGTTTTGAHPTALTSSGDTNYEDGLYRMFRNTDGTIQGSLPSKVIFFTDGVPTFTRLGVASPAKAGTTALPAATAHPDDAGLAPANGGVYSQLAWNRANRIAREFGVQVDYIGVYVGDDITQSSSWTDINAGYHLEDWKKGYHDVWEKGYHDDYQRGNKVIWEQGYHTDYQRGDNVVFQQGYHTDYQRGNNVSFEQGYHLDYQRGNTVLYQYARNGVAFEKKVSGNWVSETDAQFLASNADPTENDNHRIRVTGTLGNWTSMTATQYDKANVTAGTSDGLATTTSGTPTSWTTITAAVYNLSNTTADATDGYRTNNNTTAPYDLWQATTQALYDAGNTTSAATDGWRNKVTGTATSWTSITSTIFSKNDTIGDASDGYQTVNVTTTPFTLWQNVTQAVYDAGNTSSATTDGYKTITSGTASSWTSITAAAYTASNTTTDATDGWQIANVTTAPFSTWQTTTQALYDAGNTTVDATDGWRTRQTSSSSSWTSVPQAQYDASNSTTDSTDGWRIANSYTSPYNKWESSTQSAYNAGVGSAPTGWRTYRVYSAPFSSWEVTDEASFLANKTPGLDPTTTSDGWTATKVYAQPYTGYDATRTYTRTNRSILGQLIDPAGLVDPIKDAGGNVTNAEVANMYSSTVWADLEYALKAIALGQCGGTLTLQTRIGTTTPANDTFTYSNTLDSTKVETSGSKRSGTFDFAIPGGGTVTAEIQQQNVSALKHYAPAGWTCKAAGVAFTPQTIDVPGTPWDSIRLNIAANAAVSCIQNVTWVP
jgi:prepilin-type N-terminal cleavage/methylation domain-containing protein